MMYFRPEEFKCKCGKCSKGFAQMDARLLVGLDAARAIVGSPLVLNSAMRCPKHNGTVKGKANSSHLKGFAVDIHAEGSRFRWHLLNALLATGFNRIGIGEEFIHADTDPTKPAGVVWLYS